jgi:hypothetical protein
MKNANINCISILKKRNYSTVNNNILDNMNMDYLNKYIAKKPKVIEFIKGVKLYLHQIDHAIDCDDTNVMSLAELTTSRMLKIKKVSLLLLIAEGYLSYLEGLETKREHPLVESKPIELDSLSLNEVTPVLNAASSNLQAQVLLVCKDVFNNQTSFINYMDYRLKYRNMKYPFKLTNDIIFTENNYFFDNVDLYINLFLLCNQIENEEKEKTNENPPGDAENVHIQSTHLTLVNFLRNDFIPLIVDHLSNLKENNEKSI